MSYYVEKKNAFRELNSLLDEAKLQLKEVDIDLLVYELTELYNIGEYTIKKRIELLVKVRDDFRIKRGVIVWRKKD